jgi:hypothetical protein
MPTAAKYTTYLQMKQQTFSKSITGNSSLEPERGKSCTRKHPGDAKGHNPRLIVLHFIQAAVSRRANPFPFPRRRVAHIFIFVFITFSFNLLLHTQDIQHTHSHAH